MICKNEMLFYPVEFDEQQKYRHGKKIPIADIVALGGVYASFADVFNTFSGTVTTSNPETLYKAILTPGLELADAVGGGKRGFAKEGSRIVEQARFVEQGDMTCAISMKMPVDPATVSMAIALVAVDKKLDDISKMQDKIVNLIKTDKNSNVRGNLIMLNEIREDYMLDIDNNEQRIVKLGQVQKILNESLKNIEYYRELILRELHGKKKGINIKVDVDSIFDDITDNFKFYKMSVYTYAFAAMLECILLNQTSHEKYARAIERIEDKTFQYRELYSDTYNIIDQDITRVAENMLKRAAAKCIKGAGEVIHRIPVIEKGPVDELLIAAGENIDEACIEKRKKEMRYFSLLKDSETLTFTESIQLMDTLCNEENVLYIDSDNIYLQGC